VTSRPFALALCGLTLGLALATQPAWSQPAPAATSATDDLEIDPAEPDFTVINLPTTARLPKGKLNFRLTHRFSRALGEGDFGDLAGDLFGFDRGAQIGFEFRYGVAPGFQLGVQRTSERTTEFFGQYQLLREADSGFGLGLNASIEGLDNFGEEHSPRAALLLSKRLGARSALYVEPAFVGNTNLVDNGDDDSTLLVGLGARFGLGAGVALVGEISPRLAGFKGDDETDALMTFGLEKRVGGHAFQLNFSNGLGTTPAQVARGQRGSDWFIGFNLSRKFY
jgi:hypothetical protein